MQTTYNETFYVIQNDQGSFVTLQSPPSFEGPKVAYHTAWYKAQRFHTKEMAQRVADLLGYNGYRKARKKFQCVEIKSQLNLIQEKNGEEKERA